MKRRFKKHNNGCNGKLVLEDKNVSGNEYRCNKCKSKTIKRKKTGEQYGRIYNQTFNLGCFGN